MTQKHSQIATKAAAVMAGVLLLVLTGSASFSAIPVEPSSAGGPPVVMRLITTQEYKSAIETVFGTDIKIGSAFPALTRIDGLKALGATTAIVTPGLLDM